MRWLVEMASDILMGMVFAILAFMAGLACFVFILLFFKIIGGYFGIS